MLWSVALLALVAAGPAVAADMPVRSPVYKAPQAMVAAHNWTGFYVGGHVGGAWSASDHSTANLIDLSGGVFFFAPPNLLSIPEAAA